MRFRGTATVFVLLVMLLQGCGGDDRAPTAPAPPAESASGTAPMAGSGTPSPPGAAVFFVQPVDGATVASPVIVKFGISGMSVAPAGDSTPATGHHHLLIDTQLEDESLPVPSSAQHLHFGKGQTETSVELTPGEHRLQMVLGDANHVPHDPPVVSQRITITVE